MNETPKGFIIASPRSGSGKTTITLALLSWLDRNGYRVQPFKVGPDYIDPAYHEEVTGQPSINLDPWITSESGVRQSFRQYTEDCDVAVVEGMMGLFDGKGGDTQTGSTAHVARILDLPVVLVIDAGALSGSAGAVGLGCERFDSDLQIAGVLLNRVGSESHLSTLIGSLGKAELDVFGHLPKDSNIEVPERQLGLISAREHPLSPDFLKTLRGHVQECFDMDRLLDAAPELDAPLRTETPVTTDPAQIAIARDRAFCFYYEENLRHLREAGASLVSFSPLDDETLPEDIQGIYFGGGFPEEFSEDLSENAAMRSELKAFDGPVLGECGGLIFLCEEFVTEDGTTFPMAGRIPGSVEMTESLSGFGYREVKTAKDTFLGPAGTILRGHEFHHSRWTGRPERNWGVFQSEHGNMGYGDDRTIASYVHLHFGSRPEVARAFVESCRK